MQLASNNICHSRGHLQFETKEIGDVTHLRVQFCLGGESEGERCSDSLTTALLLVAIAPAFEGAFRHVSSDLSVAIELPSVMALWI